MVGFWHYERAPRLLFFEYWKDSRRLKKIQFNSLWAQVNSLNQILINYTYKIIEERWACMYFTCFLLRIIMSLINSSFSSFPILVVFVASQGYSCIVLWSLIKGGCRCYWYSSCLSITRRNCKKMRNFACSDNFLFFSEAEQYTYMQMHVRASWE